MRSFQTLLPVILRNFSKNEIRPANASLLIVLGTSVVLVAILVPFVDVSRLIQGISGMPFLNLFAAIFVYLFLGIVRAYRFRILLQDNSVPIVPLFGITFVHNALVHLFPMRAGELTYPLLLHYRLNQQASAGISSLIMARLFDFLFVSVGLSIGLAALGTDLPDIHAKQVTAAVIAVILGVVALYLAGRIVRSIGVLFGKLKIAGNIWWAQKFSILENGILEVAERLTRSNKPRLFLPSFGLSLVIFGLNVTTSIILIKGFGIEVGFEFLIPAVSLSMIAAVFPFSIAGFGLVETGWVAGLVFFAGLGINEAASFAFLLHGFQISFAVCMGILGYAYLHLAEPKVKGMIPEPLDSVDKGSETE